MKDEGVQSILSKIKELNIMEDTIISRYQLRTPNLGKYCKECNKI